MVPYAAFTILLLLQFATANPPLECPKTATNGRTLVVSAYSKKSDTGKWRDTFLARAETNASSDRFNWNITHSVLECDGKRYLYLKGMSDEESVPDLTPKLKFHKKTGKGVAVINGGRSAQKMRLTNETDQVAFTDRPLNDNELFELKLDERLPNVSYGLCIGLITTSPGSIEIKKSMHLNDDVYVYCNNEVWGRGKKILEDYGENISKLKVGDTFGVKRSEFDVIHFFINGVDQGPADSNVQPPVYGIIELWNNAAKATIIDKKSNNE